MKFSQVFLKDKFSTLFVCLCWKVFTGRHLVSQGNLIGAFKVKLQLNLFSNFLRLFWLKIEYIN